MGPFIFPPLHVCSRQQQAPFRPRPPPAPSLNPLVIAVISQYSSLPSALVCVCPQGYNRQLPKDKQIPARVDQVTHVYTLVIKPDSTYEVGEGGGSCGRGGGGGGFGGPGHTGVWRGQEGGKGFAVGEGEHKQRFDKTQLPAMVHQVTHLCDTSLYTLVIKPANTFAVGEGRG